MHGNLRTWGAEGSNLTAQQGCLRQASICNARVAQVALRACPCDAECQLSVANKCDAECQLSVASKCGAECQLSVANKCDAKHQLSVAS